MEPYSNKYKCECCGFYTLEQGPGAHEVCPVCFWEEDRAQTEDIYLSGGANRVSLYDARNNYAKYAACEERFMEYVREPYAEEWPEADDCDE